MIKKRVPRTSWDHGVIWVSQLMSMTNYLVNSVNGGIPLEKVTRGSVDISIYLDFSFYGKVWFKDSAGISPI